MGTDPRILERLRDGIVDNSLHYRSETQSSLWRAVAGRHNPAARDPDFEKTFQAACTAAASLLPPGPVTLIGLGSGTGAKEAGLARALGPGRCTLHFADISTDLLESCARAASACGASVGGLAAADLRDPSLPPLVRSWCRGSPCLFTFLGLLPTLPIDDSQDLLQSLCNPGDLILLNAHLAPHGDAAPILPQYDNPETRRWILQFLLDQGIPAVPEDVLFGVVNRPPTLTLQAILELRAPARLRDSGILWPSGQQVTLFQSHRHTPQAVDTLLEAWDLSPCARHLTPCGQEGWWTARRR